MASRISLIQAIHAAFVPKATLGEIPDRFLCRMCQMIMLRVYQLVCGHLVCELCKDKLEKDGYLVCPDTPSCLSAELPPNPMIFEDKCQGRAIQTFRTECIYSHSGCSWFGDLSDYAVHIEVCKPKHEQEVEVHEVFYEEKTQLKVKSSKPQSVDAKKKEVPLNDIPDDSSTSCPHCQKSQILNELQSHIDYECEKAVLLCPFTDVRCPGVQVTTRAGIDEHAKYATEIHLELLLRDHVTLKRTCTDEFRTLFSIRNECIGFPGELKKLSTAMTVISKEFKVKLLEMDRKTSDILCEMAAVKGNSQKNEVKSLGTRLSNIEAMLACFKEDRLPSEFPGGNLEQRISTLEKTVENLKLYENRLLRLEKNLDFKDSRIESLEAQLNGGELTSYDGTLLWRITDVMTKRRDAITRKKTYVLSPPFFSGPHGYKMCIRIYLNGDGQGKGTHLSVFFTVLKGPYDALLPWPFKQVVHLAILSQNGGKTVQDSFRPDPMSISFQRPKKDANISSGCPMLLPLSSLENEGYLQDDCMFLRAKVEGFSL